jgi:hypothetical protein
MHKGLKFSRPGANCTHRDRNVGLDASVGVVVVDVVIVSDCTIVIVKDVVIVPPT